MKYKKLREDAVPPCRATEGSVGYDLAACLDEALTLNPGERALVPTGIAIELEPGYGGFVFVRSSMGVRYGVTLPNCVGVVDWDYRGEMKVGLINHAREPYTIQPGDRIAQLVIMPVATPELEEAEELSETRRGAGGWGSTGKR